MMIIEEKDFRIVHEHDSFVLYLLKNKKELKEDSVNKYKIGGYYLLIENALKAIIKFRQDKKYTGGESSIQLQKDVKSFINTKDEFNVLINQLYNPILELKKQIIKYE